VAGYPNPDKRSCHAVIGELQRDTDPDARAIGADLADLAKDPTARPVLGLPDLAAAQLTTDPGLVYMCFKGLRWPGKQTPRAQWKPGERLSMMLIQAGFASHDPPADDTLWCTLYETTPVQPEQQLPKPLQIRLDVSRARALALYETHLGLPDVLGGFRRGFLAGMIESSEFAGALPPDVVLDQLERLYREAIFAATRSAPAARNALDHLEHIRRTIDSARTKAERRRRPGRIRLAGGHAGQRRSEMEAVWDELLGAHPEPARLVDLALRARDGELPRFGPER